MNTFLLGAEGSLSPSHRDKIYFENQVEDYVKKIINQHISQEKYLINATLDEKYSFPKEGNFLSFPYKSLKENQDGELSNWYGGDDAIFTAPLSLEIVFDVTVTQEKQNFILKKITNLFYMGKEQNRILSSSVKNIFSLQNEDANRTMLEAAKLESERVRLEVEREKENFLRKNKELENVVQEQKNSLEESKQNKLELEKKINGLQTTIDQNSGGFLKIFSQFQSVFMAILILIGFFILTFLGTSAFKNAFGLIASSISSFGENLSSSLKSIPNSTTMDGSVLGMGSQSSQSELQGPTSQTPENSLHEDEKDEKFLLLVEEKIQALSREGNFNFYNQFIDLVHSKLDYAASVMVSISDETAKYMVSQMSEEVVSKLESFLSSENGFSLAKGNRRKALEYFYGQIYSYEFSTKNLQKDEFDLSWISKLSTEDLVEVATNLDLEDRKRFLIFFSPSRLSMMLEMTKDDLKKEKMVDSISELGETSFEEDPAFMTRIKSIYEENLKSETLKVKKLLDGPQFLAKIISEVSQDNREKIMGKISSKGELLSSIRKYYISFDSLSHIADSALSEIFSTMTSHQIALAMFSADSTTQRTITSVLPETLKDTVKEELDLLQSDKTKQKKFLKSSIQVQEQVCKYLLMMNKDGVLEFKD